MPDQRNTARKRSFLAAYASAGGGPATIFCMVRDLSSGGAKLEVDGAQPLPDRFDLQINGRDRLFHVEVSWRTPTVLGVRFVAKSSVARPALAQAS